MLRKCTQVNGDDVFKMLLTDNYEKLVYINLVTVN